jgi:predicted secreted acid phosphatase
MITMGRTDIPSVAIGATMLAFSLAATLGSARAETAFVAGPSQPVNVGDAIAAAAAYHESGAYHRDLASVARQATAWILERAKSAGKPAVVFDIDETALANWDIIKRDNFGRPIAGPCDLALDGACGWAAWDQRAVDPAIAPTLDIFQNAKTAKVAIFFITGRPEDQRQATERNLQETGYDGFEKVYMVPLGRKYASAADFKTPVRAEIEAAGYTIIANIGDQPSDLFGGHAERLFLLPNPFYRVP